MSSLQDRLVLVALLLEETSWLFAAFGVLGVTLGAGGSPIGWVAILAVSTASLLVVRFLQFLLLPSVVASVMQMLAGIVVVYVVVGTQIGATFQGVDMGWLPAMLSGEETPNYVFRGAVGGFVGALLWWRGGHLAAMEFPEESLSGSFKLGILVLAFATVTDIAQSTDLHIFPVMFVFFAASIAGMSIAHLAPASQQATGDRAWTRVIGVVVGVVVVLGLLFSLLQRDVLSAIAAPMLFVLNGIAVVVFIVIIMPIAYVVDFLTGLLFNLVQNFASPQQEAQQLINPLGIAEDLQALRDRSGDAPIAELFLQIVQWSIVAAIIVAVLLVLAKAFRRRFDSGGRADDGTRDSVKEQADPAYDLAKLLIGLLPKRLRKSTEKAARFRVPGGDPNVVDVFRIYFGLLVKAEELGVSRPPSATPNEYSEKLESVLPQNLVRRATAAFVRACYGHHPASPEDINEMRAELEDTSK